MRLPPACLVVLVGPSGSGKSSWAAEHFRTDQIVASDDLRALVGTAATDQRAGTDAFDVLDLVLERRLARRLLTVVDTVGHDPTRRARWLELARRSGMACHAVVFDTPAELCRSRNRQRSEPVPAKVLTAQLAAHQRVRLELDAEGLDGVHHPEAVTVVPEALVAAPEAARRQGRTPLPLRFGLHLSAFPWEGGPPVLAARLAETAAAAEAVGFTSVWVMDHLLQIPQVGRPWDDMLESWTTLAWLAAQTRHVRLGTLVSGVTLRNLAHLAKIVATADVLSGGRVVCGLGAAWWADEHRRYGWRFPPPAERFALLEDALTLLPVMWGPGAPPFQGRVVSLPDTTCYPRPVQDHLPLLVGGSGERTTLRLAARYADACNLFGEPDTVATKVGVLAGHCARADRDPGAVKITHLSTAVVGRSPAEVRAAVERLGPRGAPPESVAARVVAGTVDDHVGRYRALAEVGVTTAMVALPDLAHPGTLETFGEVIAAFTPGPGGPAW